MLEENQTQKATNFDAFQFDFPCHIANENQAVLVYRLAVNDGEISKESVLRSYKIITTIFVHFGYFSLFHFSPLSPETKNYLLSSIPTQINQIYEIDLDWR